MSKSLIPLFDGSFVEGAPLEPAAINAVPVPPKGATTLPEEPSTLALGFIGIGILAAYAGVQRWRRPTQQTLRIPEKRSAEKKGAAQPPKRGAA
jgi:hypothetical protein